MGKPATFGGSEPILEFRRVLEFRRDRLLYFPTDIVELDCSPVMTRRFTLSHRTDDLRYAHLQAAHARLTNGAGRRVSNLEAARPTPPLPSTLMLRASSCPGRQATGGSTRITTIDPFDPAPVLSRCPSGGSISLNHPITYFEFDPDPSPRYRSGHRWIRQTSASASSLTHQLIQRFI